MPLLFCFKPYGKIVFCNFAIIKRNMKNIVLASTSTLYGGQYLDYLKDTISELFAGVDTIVFVPFARPGGISHDEYTAKASEFFSGIGINVVGLHTFDNKVEAIKNAQGFFTGGGNTFLLVKELHEAGLMAALKAVVESGTPYMGASAGSNIGGMNMRTTNDMPIVYPPSFDTMGLVPFNLNPHYLDPQPELKHNGETRETRIREFHTQNTIPVVGLREGNWIRVKGDKISVEGSESTRIFEAGKDPYELPSGAPLNF